MYTRIEKVLLIATLTVAAFMVTFPLMNYDIFWHLADGREMVRQGNIIEEEVFSFTAGGEPFHNREWLAQLIFYLIYGYSGASGLITLKVLLTAAVAFLLFRTARITCAGPVGASIAVIAVLFTSLVRFTVRPQLFSFLFLSLSAYLLFAFREGKAGKGRLFVIPVVIVLWDFLHGAFFGLIFLTAFTMGETAKVIVMGRGRLPLRTTVMSGPRMKTVWVLCGVSFLAFALNPWGLVTYGDFLGLAGGGTSMLSMTEEFGRTGFGGFLFFWLLLGLLVLLIALNAGRADITHILILLPFTVMAIKFNRAVAAFSIASLPALAYLTGLTAARFGRNRLFKATAVAVAAGLLLLVATVKLFTPGSPLSFGTGLNKDRYPVGAVRFIKETGIKGNMFNMGRLGGYLAYHLHPGRAIFLYNLPAVFDDVLMTVRDGTFLKRYSIHYALTEGDTTWMFSGGDWEPVYWDNVTSIFVRATPDNLGVIEKFGLRYYTPWIKAADLRRLESNPAAMAGLTREVARCLYFAEDLERARYLSMLLLKERKAVSYRDALSLAGAGLRRNPNSARLWSALGQIHYRNGNNRKAEAALLRSMEIDNGLSLSHITLGFIRYDGGDYDGALNRFGEALVLDGNNPYIYYGLALTQEKKGDHAEAIRNWEKFLELVPSGDWADRAGERLRRLKGRK